MPLARFCLSTHLECRRISAGVTCPSAAPRRLASLTKIHCSKGSGIEAIFQSRLRTIILPESYTAFEVLDIIFLRGRCLRQISFPGSSDCTSVWMLRGKHLESLEWGLQLPFFSLVIWRLSSWSWLLLCILLCFVCFSVSWKSYAPICTAELLVADFPEAPTSEWCQISYDPTATCPETLHHSRMWVLLMRSWWSLGCCCCCGHHEK